MRSLRAGVITCSFIFLSWHGASESTSGLESVTPQYQEVPAGDEVVVLFRALNGLPISECSFKVDALNMALNETITWTASNVGIPWTPKRDSGNSMFQGRYNGSGLQHGECGVTLSNVDSLHFIGVRVVQGLSVHLEFATVDGYKVPPIAVEVRPSVQTVAAGSDVNITCLHHGGPLEKCAFRLLTGSWVHFNNGHDSASTSRYHYQGRGLQRGQCGIRLLNVTAEDSGWYICSLITGKTKQETKIGHRISALIVSGGKPSVEVAVQKTVYEVGERLVATCRVTGPHPLPVTVWRLGDVILPSEDTKLKESRNAWLWEEQSSTLELNTVVGTQFKDLPLRCEQLKGLGCMSNVADNAANDFKMITVKPNCGVRIQVKYDSSTKCEPPAIMLRAAKFVDDTVDQPTDHSKVKKLKKKFEGYPWHAGIYKFVSQNDTPSADGKIHRLFEQICGGTLITKRHVLTAAHCFGEASKREVNRNAVFKVSLGKYYRDYGQFDCRVQWREVGMKQVHVHPRYTGYRHSYKYDLAVIDLGKPVLLTTRVGLACVDWEHQYSSQLLVKGNSGWLSGWGYMSKDGEFSEVLRTLALPYMDPAACLDHLVTEVRHLLTSDKFCAGFRARDISACPGDSGGGLLFNHSSLAVYYVSGIASTAFRPASFMGKCFKDEVTSFTSVAEFLPWLKEVVRWANTTAFRNLFYKERPIRDDFVERKFPRVEPKIEVWELP